MEFSGLKKRLKLALNEDRIQRDRTTLAIPGANKDIIHLALVAKEKGIFCGGFLLKPLFGLLDPSAQIKTIKRDGNSVKKGQVLARIKGKAAALFGGERTFLNLASRLSGIATLTHSYVQAVKGTKVKICDTRKTTPLWRDLEKYAVRMGQGTNHRQSLEDAILIKDNHLTYLQRKGLTPLAVYGSKRSHVAFLELEAQSLKDVWDGIKIKADIIMLDNMSLDLMKKSIYFIQAAQRALRSKTPQIEISGGVTLKNIKQLAKLGIDRISIGALTHSAPSLDLSMEVM